MSVPSCATKDVAENDALSGCDELPDIGWHEQWFSAYVERFRTGSETDIRYIALKYDHSLRVLGYAREIIPTLSLPEELQRAALLAALYHDTGRFQQYALYHTFSDRLSENHGHLGAKVLKREQPLQYESRTIQRYVICAVAMHNRFMLPEAISPELRCITEIVRDSDKLDIFPVLLANFTRDGSKSDVVTMHLEDKDGAYSEAVLHSLLQRRLARYTDMKYINDFKLLLGSWVFDLNTEKARKLLQASGNLERLLTIFPQGDAMERAKKVIREALPALCDTEK